MWILVASCDRHTLPRANSTPCSLGENPLIPKGMCGTLLVETILALYLISVVRSFRHFLKHGESSRYITWKFCFYIGLMKIQRLSCKFKKMFDNFLFEIVYFNASWNHFDLRHRLCSYRTIYNIYIFYLSSYSTNIHIPKGIMPTVL